MQRDLIQGRLLPEARLYAHPFSAVLLAFHSEFCYDVFASYGVVSFTCHRTLSHIRPLRNISMKGHPLCKRRRNGYGEPI